MFHFRSLGRLHTSKAIGEKKGRLTRPLPRAHADRQSRQHSSCSLFDVRNIPDFVLSLHWNTWNISYFAYLLDLFHQLCVHRLHYHIGAGESPRNQTFSGIFQRKTSRTSPWITRLIGSDGFLNLLHWLLGGSHCFNSLPWLCFFIPFSPLLHFISLQRMLSL